MKGLKKPKIISTAFMIVASLSMIMAPQMGRTAAFGNWLGKYSRGGRFQRIENIPPAKDGGGPVSCKAANESCTFKAGSNECCDGMYCDLINHVCTGGMIVPVCQHPGSQCATDGDCCVAEKCDANQNKCVSTVAPPNFGGGCESKADCSLGQVCNKNVQPPACVDPSTLWVKDDYGDPHCDGNDQCQCGQQCGDNDRNGDTRVCVDIPVLYGGQLCNNTHDCNRKPINPCASNADCPLGLVCGFELPRRICVAPSTCSNNDQCPCGQRCNPSGLCEDNDPPKIAEVLPQNGSYLGTNGGILVTFTKPMDLNSVKNSITFFPVLLGAGNPLPVRVIYWLSSGDHYDTASFLISPSGLTQNTVYVLRISPGAKSIYGDALKDGSDSSFIGGFAPQ